MVRVVILKLEGDLETGVQVTLKQGQINQQGLLIESEIPSQLPPNPTLNQLYLDWRQSYLNLEEICRQKLRLELEVEDNDFQQNCHELAQQLQDNFNIWLHSRHHNFDHLRRRLIGALKTTPIRVLIQTDNPQLQRLPWHLWRVWENNHGLELILSPSKYEKLLPRQPYTQLKVLALLGDSTGIDVQKDKEILEQLPNADVTFLVQPQRQELSDRLWKKPWDILFFAGHSQSEQENKIGRFYINSRESLTIKELKHGLKQAINSGLRLAIFNSCDGLGLANELADLNLPQGIFMKEPVPDLVAQKFLEFFLQGFTQGQSVQQSVKIARQRLEALEDILPYATWLPVIYQHPMAEMLHPKPFLKSLGIRSKTLIFFFLFFLGMYGLNQIFTQDYVIGDYMSQGEELLSQTSPSRFHQKAVPFIQDCTVPWWNNALLWNPKTWHRWQNCWWTKQNYQQAANYFYQAWLETQDPETLIYLNNLTLDAENIEANTIAVIVPVHHNSDGSIQDSHLAQEILRGISQLQTEVNLNFFQKEDFPGKDFLQPRDNQGKGLKVIILDDENDIKVAKKRANLLVKQTKVLGVVGHYASDMTIETVDIFNRNHLVLISPGSTSQELTNPPRNYFFRTVYTTTVEAQALVNYAQQKGISKAAIFYNPGSAYTHSFWLEFKKQFKHRGGTLINLQNFDISQENFDTQQAIAEVQRYEDIAIIIIPDGQVTNALQNSLQLMEANQGKNVILGASVVYSAKTLQEITKPTSLDNLVIAVPWHPAQSPNLEFPQQAQKLWGGPVNARTAPSYDAALALIKAIAQQEKPNRKETQNILSDPTFFACGATGVVSFQPNGNRDHLPGTLVKIVSSQHSSTGLTFVPVGDSTVPTQEFEQYCLPKEN